MKIVSKTKNNKRISGIIIFLLLFCYLFATSAIAQQSEVKAKNTEIKYSVDPLSYGDVWAFDNAAYTKSKYSLYGGTTGFTHYTKGAAGNTDKTKETVDYNYFATVNLTGGQYKSGTFMSKVDYNTRLMSNVTVGTVKSPIAAEGIPDIPVAKLTETTATGIYSVVPGKAGNYSVHLYVENPTDETIQMKYAMLDSCADTNAYAANGFDATSGVHTVTLSRIGEGNWYRGTVNVENVHWNAVFVSNKPSGDEDVYNSTTGNSGADTVYSGSVDKTNLTLNGSGGNTTTYYFVNNWTVSDAHYNTVLAFQIPAGTALGPISSEGTLSITNQNAERGTLTAQSIFGEELAVDGQAKTLPGMRIVLTNQVQDGFKFNGYFNGSVKINFVAGEDKGNRLFTITDEEKYLYYFEADAASEKNVTVTWAEDSVALPTISVTEDSKIFNFTTTSVGEASFTRGTKHQATFTLNTAGADSFQYATYTVTGDTINGVSTYSGTLEGSNLSFTVTMMYDETEVAITAVDKSGTSYAFTYTFIPQTSGTAVVQNWTTQKNYVFLEDALKEAKTGETLKLLTDASFRSPAANENIQSTVWKNDSDYYTVPSGVTFVVPYKTDDTGAVASGTSLKATEVADTVKPFRTLTVPADVHLTINGTLIANAEQGQVDTQWMGNVVSAYGHIVLNGTMDVKGTLQARGVISGSGSIHAYSGAKVYQLLQFTDFRGGQGTVDIYTSLEGTGGGIVGTFFKKDPYEAVFPLNLFYLQNIQVEIRYDTGSQMHVTYYVNASAVETGDMVVVGPSGADGSQVLFLLTDGYLVMKYDAERAKTPIELYGKLSISSFAISIDAPIVGNISLDTSEYIAPLSGAFDITVCSGSEVSIPQKFKILPGCTITIDEGAKATISSEGELYLYDVADYKASADLEVGYCYLGYRTTPSTAGAKTITETEDAKLIVNGELIVNGKMYVSNGAGNASSSIRTTAGTGKIIMNNAQSSNRTFKEGLQKSSGAEKTTVTFAPAKADFVGSAAGVYSAIGNGTWYSNGSQWYKHKIIVNGTDVYYTATDEFKLEGSFCSATTDNGSYADGKVTGLNKQVVNVTTVDHVKETLPAKEATCTEAGYSAHQACARCDYTEGKTDYPATGHTKGTAAFTWTEYSACSATVTCSACNTTETKAATIGEPVTKKEATCTEAGELTYTATVTLNGHKYTDTKTKAVDPLDHDWAAATCTAPKTCQRSGCGATEGTALGHAYAVTGYTWAEDHSKVTATGVCANDANHTKTLDSNPSTYETTDATCVAEGQTVYTATFAANTEWTNLETQTEKVTLAIDGNAHDWNETTYDFASNGKTCSAERVCKHNAEHKESATATTITFEVTQAPTCTEMGTTTYTATFDVAWAETQTKDVADVENLGHNYVDGVCGVCGSVLGDPIAVGYSMQATLTLKNEIYMNVQFVLENLGAIDPTTLTDRVGLLIWDSDELPAEEDAVVDNCDYVITSADYDTEKEKFIAHTKGIPAKNLGDALSFRAYYIDNEGNYKYGRIIPNYSPKKYCYNMLNDDENDDDALMIAILNYCTAAQKYFEADEGYNYSANGQYINADLSDAQKAIYWDGTLVRTDWSVPSTKEGALTRNKEVVTSRAASLTLSGAIDYNYSFKVEGIEVANAQILTWTEDMYKAAEVLTEENAEVFDLQLDNGKYVYKYKGLPARQMFSPIYACAKFTDTNDNVYYSGVVPYCPERFATINAESKIEVDANLAKCMVIYGNEARSFFKNRDNG